MIRHEVENVVVIPARGGSKGVPRKNLRIVEGLPLVAYAIRTALNIRDVDRVAVSTEDEEIASVSSSLGVEIIKRPEELAEDEISLPEVIKHAKIFLEKKGIFSKRYISLQPTGPLITSQSISKAISLHERTNCDSVVSIAEITHGHPYWIKSYDRASGKLDSFLDVEVHKYPQKQDLPRCYTYTGGFYIRKTEMLNELSGFYLGEDIRGYLLTADEALDIDSEEDMRYFEFLINEQMQ